MSKETCFLGLRRGRACVHMRGRRCTQAIRPSAWPDVVCACVRVRACLLVLAHARSLSCMHSSASFSLADVPSTHHQHSTTPTPVTAPFSTAMVSQALVHCFARPPSLRVVSCPVSRLASASSRRAATGIRPSIHSGQRPSTVIKGRYLRGG
jgi:hypothetical protein